MNLNLDDLEEILEDHIESLDEDENYSAENLLAISTAVIALAKIDEMRVSSKNKLRAIREDL